MSDTCSVHPDQPATSTCEDCGRGLCGACAETALGRTWCASCMAARVNQSAARGNAGAVSGNAGVAGTSRLVKLPWLAFMLTVLPGLGQVYDGFVLRGIAQFGVFWVLKMLTEEHLPGITLEAASGIALLAFWLWCAFDASRTAHELNRRGYGATAQEARTITRGPMAESELRYAGIGLVVAGALLFAQQIGGFVLSVFRFTWPIVLIALGAWILHRARQRREREASGSTWTHDAPSTRAGA